MVHAVSGLLLVGLPAMWDWVDHLGGILCRSSPAAAILSSLVVLAMLGCRQPARRIALARATLLGSLILLVLVPFAPLPRFDLAPVLRGGGVLPHPLLPSSMGRGVGPGWGPKGP